MTSIIRLLPPPGLILLKNGLEIIHLPSRSSNSESEFEVSLCFTESREASAWTLAPVCATIYDQQHSVLCLNMGIGRYGVGLLTMFVTKNC